MEKSLFEKEINSVNVKEMERSDGGRLLRKNREMESEGEKERGRPCQNIACFA